MHESGNGLHINVSIKSDDGKDLTDSFMAGILDHAVEMTAFFNPVKESYKRLGEKKAPKYVAWSPENRSQLIRIPAVKSSDKKRIELRSPDPCANPYIAYALIIYAGLDGIKRGLTPGEPNNSNLFTAESGITDGLVSLPDTLEKAKSIARHLLDINGEIEIFHSVEDLNVSRQEYFLFRVQLLDCQIIHVGQLFFCV